MTGEKTRKPDGRPRQKGADGPAEGAADLRSVSQVGGLFWSMLLRQLSSGGIPGYWQGYYQVWLPGVLAVIRCTDGRNVSFSGRDWKNGYFFPVVCRIFLLKLIVEIRAWSR